MGLFDKFVKVDDVDFGDDFTNAVYRKGKKDGADQESLHGAYLSIASGVAMALAYTITRIATNKRNKEIDERILKNECAKKVLSDVEGSNIDYIADCKFEDILNNEN